MNTFRARSKKVLIGIVGGMVVVVGLVLVPYPGPGWLIVFGGLAILSTEFVFATKVLAYARGKYDDWTHWLKRQNIVIRLAVLSLTGLVVLVTLWLLNVYGFFIHLFGLPIEWLVSPLNRS